VGSRLRDGLIGVAVVLAFCVFAYLILELQFQIWDWLGLSSI
jgi:hypothetical protein